MSDHGIHVRSWNSFQIMEFMTFVYFGSYHVKSCHLCQIMSNHVIHVIHVKSCHSCQIMSNHVKLCPSWHHSCRHSSSVVKVGIFTKDGWGGGVGCVWGRQKVLSRLSADSFAVGRRQKVSKHVRPMSNLLRWNSVC
jgi:hypothetical protein